MFYYLEDNNINDDRVLNMNYCGYIVKLDFFNELQLNDVINFHKGIPFLKEAIVYFKTDPNLKLSSINTEGLKIKNNNLNLNDEIEFSTESNVLDRFSKHLHKLNGTSKEITHNNTCGAINFPLINCNKDTVTSWYRLISGSPQVKDYLSRGDNCKFELIESTCLYDNQPNIIRTEQWHNVLNKSNKMRVIANIDFRWHMTWDDIKYSMSDYIQ